MDFGPIGSDTVTLPLFTYSVPFPIEIWEGVPGTPKSSQICSVTYDSGWAFNTYIPQTFTLPRRLRGVTSVTFVFRQKVHLKGFSFEPPQKAYMKLTAADCDAIYGDSFKKKEHRIEKIGNNVTISFRDMVFSVPPAGITISGRTPLAENPIQLRLKSSGKDDIILTLNFKQAEGYTERQFQLKHIPADTYDLELIFLPGCDFDLEWIQLSPRA